MSGGRFVCFAGATFAFGTSGIMLVASYWFRAYIAGVITDLATSPTVVVAVGAGRTCGSKLVLEIGNAGLKFAHVLKGCDK